MNMEDVIVPDSVTAATLVELWDMNLIITSIGTYRFTCHRLVQPLQIPSAISGPLLKPPYLVSSRLDEAAVALQKEKNMYKEIENFPMCFKVNPCGV